MTIVYFYAGWCSNCRMLGPLVRKRAAEVGATLEEIDADSSDGVDVARGHHVKGVPTLVFVEDGKEVNRLTGNIGELDLQNVLGAEAGG